MNFTHWFQLLLQSWQHELYKLVNWPLGPLECVWEFVRYFPLLLSLCWSVSALLRLTRSLSRGRGAGQPGVRLPSFTVLIPFYGDGEEALRSVASLRDLKIKPKEIVLIDDGSPPGFELNLPSSLPVKVRILKLPRNVGKAAALNQALRTVKTEVIVCLDADTTAETMDWTPMLSQFVMKKGLGAVTGKIRPKNIRNLTQLMQAIDYLAVICMVKCAESLWGGLTTVSGAWVAYRRQALLECGGWNSDTTAEDIDLSWRLQASGWQLHYDIDWTANVEMARRWGSLWRQRKRWSSGMARTLREQHHGVFHTGARHGIVSFFAVMGCIWIVSSLGLALFSLCKAVGSPAAGSWLPGHEWLISLGSAAFLLQLLVGILIDRSSWSRYPLILLLAPFYPVYFWCILFTSNIAGLYHGFFSKDGGKWQPTNLPAANPLEPIGTNDREIATVGGEEGSAHPESSNADSIVALRKAELTGVGLGKSKRAFAIQAARLSLLAWGLLCFYSALSIALKLPGSSATFTAELVQLAVGLAGWTLACWRLPARRNFAAKVAEPVSSPLPSIPQAEPKGTPEDQAPLAAPIKVSAARSADATNPRREMAKH